MTVNATMFFWLSLLQCFIKKTHENSTKKVFTQGGHKSRFCCIFISFCHHQWQKSWLFQSRRCHTFFEKSEMWRSLKKIGNVIKRKISSVIFSLQKSSFWWISHYQWYKSHNNVCRAYGAYWKSENASQSSWDILHGTQGIT